MLDLSIIIVSYNKQEYLQQCLESIYDNISPGLQYELIVVDNNSQDRTLQMLQEKYTEVKLITNDQNVGFARANNQGLQIAKGKNLLLLNNDTFILAGAIEKMLEFLNENPRAGAVGPALLLQDGVTIQPQGSGRGNKFWLSIRPLAVPFLTGAAFMLRREVLEEVGGLDENFFFYNEDLDWCKRILMKKWQIYYLPQAKIIHYGGQSTSMASEKALVEGYRGGLYLCYKYHRPFIYPYRLLLLIFSLIQIVWNIFLLLIWKNKISSWHKLKGFFIIFGIVLSGGFKQRKLPKTKK